MAGGSGALHENSEVLRPETVERHRAIVSLMEELEAIDWYDQRVDAARDQDLRDVLAHNRDEEKEHAAMALEWLRTYLFSDKPLLQVEHEAEQGDGPNESSDEAMSAGLRIGSLRDR
jgi:hypothetical protein